MLWTTRSIQHFSRRRALAASHGSLSLVPSSDEEGCHEAGRGWTELELLISIRPAGPSRSSRIPACVCDWTRSVRPIPALRRGLVREQGQGVAPSWEMNSHNHFWQQGRRQGLSCGPLCWSEGDTMNTAPGRGVRATAKNPGTHLRPRRACPSAARRRLASLAAWSEVFCHSVEVLASCSLPLLAPLRCLPIWLFPVRFAAWPPWHWLVTFFLGGSQTYVVWELRGGRWSERPRTCAVVSALRGVAQSFGPWGAQPAILRSAQQARG